MKITFKTIYPDFKIFQSRIVDPLLIDFGDKVWCSPEKMLVSWEAIYNYMFRTFNYRQLRYKSDKTHELIINTFIEKLPGFYANQLAYVEHNFKKLFDVHNLGEMVSVNNLVKQMQNQKQLNKSVSASTISPHGFTDALNDMSISDATQAESESENQSDLTSKNDSQGKTKRIQLLDKLIQLSEAKFNFQLKNLMSNFEDIFVRFQINNFQGDEDIYNKLLEILKNSENIIITDDKEKVTIQFDLKNIEGSLSDLIQSKVDLNHLDNTVSKTQGNVLQVDSKDKKLYVAKGQGTAYFADEKTIHLDTSNNHFSAIGVESGNKEIPVITGENLYKLGITVEDHVNVLKEVEKELKNNETSISNNTKSIATNKDLIDINTKSIQNNKDFINNKCVKKDSLDDIVVSQKDKPDNVLQVLNGDELYVPATNVKWKILALPSDFKLNNLNSNLKAPNPVNYVFEAVDKRLKDNSAHLIFVRINQGSNIFTVYQKTIFNTYNSQSYQNVYNIYASDPLNSEFNITIETNNYPLVKDGMNVRVYTGLQTVSKIEIIIWYLEDAFEVPPIPPIPPSPTISKQETYTFFKESFYKN